MKKLVLVGVLSLGTLFAQDTGSPKGPAEDGAVVPEPATIGMLAAGLGAFAFGAWRKTRKR